MAKAPVFEGVDGNKYIFPGHVTGDYSSTAVWEHCRLIVALTDLKQDETLEFDLDDFPHVEVELRGHIFMHGYAKAWLFAGPEFDSIVEEVKGAA